MDYLALSIFSSVLMYCVTLIHLKTHNTFTDRIIKLSPLVIQMIDSLTALRNAGKAQPEVKESTENVEKANTD